MMFSLPTCEHRMSLICVFFQQCFVVFGVHVLHCLVRFTPKYFILFDAIVSGIWFVISSSDCSLFGYRTMNHRE